MSRRVVNAEQEREKRQIRLKIGRLRRRLDGRAYRLRNEGRRLTSWRTYAARYTTGATAAAFGLGLALAAGLSGRSLFRWTAMRLIRQGLDRVGHGLWDELSRVWNEPTPRPAPESKPASPGEAGHA